MKTQLMTQVTNSIFKVMETMFFLTLEPMDPKADPPPADEVLKTAAIRFSGKFSGTIFLEVPLSLLSGMTRDFMGENMEAISQEHVEGTLKEALNMVAGNALTRVDETAYMGLGLPEIIPSPAGVDDTVFLNSGQGVMAAHIKLD